MSKQEDVTASIESTEGKLVNDEQEAVKIEAPKSRPRTKKPADLPVVERRNWLIHQHYIRKEFNSCKQVIQEQLVETSGQCEYALYIQAMISKYEGKIAESTELLQICATINPHNGNILKQIARNLFLIGKYKNAIECYNRAAELSAEPDWEISHHLGICFLHLKQYETCSMARRVLDLAEQNLSDALERSKHDLTFSALARLYLETNRIDKAVDILKSGIDFSPENTELLNMLGLLYLRMENFHRAFELLGQAMTFDPENYKAILAAGSLMQVHGDFDVALTKYRVAAQKCPESAALWNNIAMCFFGKKKYVAAISCLKRATYLAPFDWRILYNLSLLHLTMQQYASAFQFACTALKLKPKSGSLFMLLAVALKNLGDIQNTKRSYEQAIELQPNNMLIMVNYAAFLHEQKDTKGAVKLFKQLERMNKESNDLESDKEALEMIKKLGAALHMGDMFVSSLDEARKLKKSSKDKKKKRSDSKQNISEENIGVEPKKKESSSVASPTPPSKTQELPSPLGAAPIALSRSTLPPVGGSSLPPLKKRQPLDDSMSRIEKLIEQLPDPSKHSLEISPQPMAE